MRSSYCVRIYLITTLACFSLKPLSLQATLCDANSESQLNIVISIVNDDDCSGVIGVSNDITISSALDYITLATGPVVVSGGDSHEARTIIGAFSTFSTGVFS